jgi:hypothetical protein
MQKKLYGSAQKMFDPPKQKSCRRRCIARGSLLKRNKDKVPKENHINEKLARRDGLPRRENKFGWSKIDQSENSKPRNTKIEADDWTMVSLTTQR